MSREILPTLPQNCGRIVGKLAPVVAVLGYPRRGATFTNMEKVYSAMEPRWTAMETRDGTAMERAHMPGGVHFGVKFWEEKLLSARWMLSRGGGENSLPLQTSRFAYTKHRFVQMHLAIPAGPLGFAIWCRRRIQFPSERFAYTGQHFFAGGLGWAGRPLLFRREPPGEHLLEITISYKREANF